MARPKLHRTSVALALIAVASGCSPDIFLGTDDREAALPDEAFVRRGLPPEASADEPRETTGSTAAGGPSVQVTRLDETPPVLRVRVTDVGDGGVEWGGTASCRIVLRLYAGAGAEGRDGEPAWRSDAAPGVGCDGGIPDSAVAAAAAARRFPVHSILGDSLRGGRYFATATVRSGDVARTVDAGSVYLWTDTLPPVTERDRLRWVVETAVVGTAPAELVASVTVTNTGRRRVRLAYDRCALRLRLYRTPLRLLPVWRAEERGNHAGHDDSACTEPPSYVVLAPRESFAPEELTVTASVPEILGDSLREGHYYVGAELALPGDSAARPSPPGWTRFIGGGTTERDRVPLEAGVVELRGRRGQLTAERTVGGLTYRAASRLVRGAGGADTVRVAVVMSNTGGQRVVTAVLRDCPVLAYAYRDPDVRDVVPMRAADWEPPATRCGPAAHRFALDPGASWVFHADIPAATLAPLAAEALHITAVLRTPDRLVTLAAGGVEVR